MRKRQKAQKARRRTALRKRVFSLIVIAVLALAAIFIVRAILNAAYVMNQESNARENKVSGGVAISVSDIVHLSFPQLSVTEGDGRITVAQFTDILEDLYLRGFVLVDVYNISGVEEDGRFTVPDLSAFPEGKTPLVISERDVSYAFDRTGDGNGYAHRLVLDEEGNIKCEYKQQYGEGIIVGDYDLVPVLESFIEEHPDFSYEGARGVLGLTGYNGILGYRTAPYLAELENNPYAEANGIFDTEIEKEEAAPVINALIEKGWHFALNGYGNTSYGSESSIVISDIDNWMNEVSPLIGGTDLCIFPFQTDIGSWEPYSSDNTKYNYLKEKGFNHFFIKTGNESLLQITNDYVREGIFEISTIEEYRETLEETGASERIIENEEN